MGNGIESILREVAILYEQAQRKATACCTDDVTHAQCLIISNVGRQEAKTVIDLSETLGVDKGWVSRTVNQLNKDGLIDKVTDENDKRSKTLSLTDQGQSQFEDLNTVLNAHAQGVMNRIEEKDKASVEHALTILRDALRDELNEGVINQIGSLISIQDLQGQ